MAARTDLIPQSQGASDALIRGRRGLPTLAGAVCCALCVYLPAAAAAQPPAAPSGSHRICSGSLDLHVVDALDHVPIPDVAIVVNQVAAGQTDARGRLTLTGLCEGDISVEAARLDYQPARQVIRLAGAASVEIELEIAFTETVTIVAKAPPPVDMRSTATVSGAALERKRGQSLSETVADVPGVSQLGAGSGVAKPVVRGQLGRRLPLMVDGVRHRSQDWGLDHAPEIDPILADRITIVRGASGVRHGSDAIGGAVLVDPPDPPSKPGTAGQAHLVGSSNGLGGSLAGRARWVSAAAPRLAWQADGSIKRLAAPATPDYPLDNTGESEWSAGLTTSYRAGGDDTYKLSYRHYQADLGVCTCYRVESPADFFAQTGQGKPLGSDLFTSRFEIARPYQAVAHELAMARGRWTAGAAGIITGTYAFQLDHRREFDIVRQATTGPQFMFRLWTHDLDAVFEHKPLHLSEHLHLQGSVGIVGMLQVHSYQGLPLVPSHEAAGAGAYLSERLSGHDFEIEAGMRYDLLARTAFLARGDFLRLVRSGQLAENACGELRSDTGPVDCTSAFHTISASLGGLLRLSPRWSAKVDLSTASRPPNPDEQYMNGTSPSFPVLGLGKPDLGPETSYAASATTTYAGDRISGEVSAHASFIADYMYFAPAIGDDGRPIFDVLIRGVFPRFVTRPVDALFYGADGSLSVAPASWLEIGAQGSMVRARNLTDSSYLVFIPPDRVRGSVAVARKGLLGLEKATASVAGTYVARQTRFDLTADLAPPPDAYAVADAEIAAEAQVGGGQALTFALRGTNLLGARYRDYTSLLRYFADRPGRQLMLRITLSYESSNPSP